jgi:cohesin complex subunit SA-1/2
MAVVCCRQQIISDTTVALDLLELATDDPPQIRRAIGELFYDYVIGQKLYTSQSGTIGFSLI